ncbi:transcriptional regulator [Microbacterium mangrovi]|uniref:Transcriptional regulator n=1 Tax=Microbacterium mangrovi TaxID=1348253 RepID=A0A0B2A5V9_9MICO|nr:DUF4307 domain-containing protein [Microbacterium mangrovi]KHK98470.1 transcriptional regulator [Microbacterium mangrovi]
MTTQAMLDERYGRTRARTSRIRSTVLSGIVIAVIIGVIAWMSFGNQSNSVGATATSYKVVDASSTTITFQLTAPAGARVACVLEADDTDHGIVGWRVIEYPASPAGHNRTLTEQIPTVGRATTGLVNSCWVP